MLGTNKRFGNRYKVTNFCGGGLREDILERNFKLTLQTPKKFISPRKIDNRDMCLSSNYQGNNANCVGYSVAGYCEFCHWKTEHYPIQFDAAKIYKEAKKLEGNDIEGTYLKYGGLAALSLGFIEGTIHYIDYPQVKSLDLSEKRIKSIKFAIHEYGVCVAGFNLTNDWNYVSKTGIIRNFNENSILIGGHAVLLCGYDDKGVYLQNSWGDNWGHYGFAILNWNMFDNQFKNAIVVKSS